MAWPIDVLLYFFADTFFDAPHSAADCQILHHLSTRIIYVAMEWSSETRRLIEIALKEDVGSGDVTTSSIVESSLAGSAQILAREPLVVAGQQLVPFVLESFDTSLSYRELVADGSSVAEGAVIAEIHGRFASILSVERVCLNFLQRLCGVANAARRLTDLVAPLGVMVLDTRKTTPGWRELEKYAVRCGGGANHRQGLFDKVLIKNNHISVCRGGIREAITRAQQAHSSIEVEVRSLAELEVAIEFSVDGVLLDNMSPEQVHRSVSLIRAKAGDAIFIEASGGISELNCLAYAQTGIDAFSSGSITHSARAADISLRIVALPR